MRDSEILSHLLQMADVLDDADAAEGVQAGSSTTSQAGCLWTVVLDCPENDESASKMLVELHGEDWCRARWRGKNLRSRGLFDVPEDIAAVRETWSVDQCVRFFHDGIICIPLALAAVYGVKTCSV